MFFSACSGWVDRFVSWSILILDWGPTSVVVLEQTRCSITGGGSAVKAQMFLAGSRVALHSWPSVWIEKSDVTSRFPCDSGAFHRCGKGVRK